jgi:hypothetical protein
LKRPVHKLGIAAEVVNEYLRVRRRFWALLERDVTSGVGAVRTSAAARPKALSDDALRTGRELGYAVNRIVALMPGESRCLMRSVVLTALLARRGIESTIVVGVRPGSTFLAHAWVEIDGEALLPPQVTLVERLVEV